MNETLIKENSSFEDIASWGNLSTDKITFRISKRSSFGILAEGLIPSLLSSLDDKGIQINLKLEFEESDIDEAKLFHSLAGYALAYASKSILDQSNKEILQQLLDNLWFRQADLSQSVIGDGKKLSLISREPDSPIPLILKTTAHSSIPNRDAFQTALRSLGQHIGITGQYKKYTGRFLDSSNEDQVTTFLYEAFRNVQDHAPPKKTGIWGIIVEKIIVTNQENIYQQKRFPEFLKSYINKCLDTNAGSKPLVFVAISVCDFGPGIQNTLPKLENESDYDHITRAFSRGVSRKPRSGSPRWGQGLANISDIAGHLNGLLYTYSSGHSVIKDPFSPSDNFISPPAELNYPKHPGGTILSIIWPVKDEHPDQQWLPLFADII